MPEDERTWPLPKTVFTYLPPSQPIECIVRLYVIKVNLSCEDDISSASPSLEWLRGLWVVIWVLLLIGRAVRQICFNKSEALPDLGSNK